MVDPSKPYSGPVHGWRRDNGSFIGQQLHNVFVEGTLKNGRFDGLYTALHKNSLDKLEEGEYKDGKKWSMDRLVSCSMDWLVF